MKKTLPLFLSLAFITSGYSQSNKTAAPAKHISIDKSLQQGKDYLSKTVILKVKPAYRNLCSNNVIDHPQLKQLFTLFGVQQLAKKYPHHQPPREKFNAQGQAFADLSLIYELSYTADHSLEKVANKLADLGIFEYAEPHYLPHLTYSPNDPFATPAMQYHLARIDAFTGWNVNQGDTNVVIGITDTGTDPMHNDLSGNIKHNYNDPVDGIDNDGDTYVDNFSGWDVGMNDNDPTWQTNAHGVHVCGIAAATANNSIGGSGVGLNCKFLPVKIANANGDLVAAYEGITYAADHGAHVINCSWGGAGGSSYGQDVITYATINKNSLVVAASGNNNAFGDFFPASYDYVISVASTNNGDGKSSFSNYGYNVDVTAPGDTIRSTWPGNFYITSSGTSMASPVATGVAAIIKAQFPSYTGLQVGEQMKATTDDISAQNAIYQNKLGTGRVNLNNALTQTGAQSIVMTSRAVVDSNDNAFVVGDTLFIRGVFVNYLAPATNATATLATFLNGGYLTMVDNTTTLGPMSTMGSVNNYNDPFKFVINAGTPQNTQITFKLIISDGTYTSNTFFNVTVNVDYINVTINDVLTSITSKGKIGYNQDQQMEGLGFNYNGTSMLYEAALMIGSSPNAVSDEFRGTGSGSDLDFQSALVVHTVIPSVKSEFDLNGQFNDLPASPTQNLLVTHNAYAWSTFGNSKYVMVEYIMKNNGATVLDSLYAGIAADWDIDGATFANNKSDYDAVSKMGYTWCTNSGGKYAGIKLLTNTAPPNFYAIDNVSGGGGGIDVVNGAFDTPEKYIALSTPRLQGGNTLSTGNDVLNVMSSGPFTINPGDSAIVAFALIAGDDLNDIQVSADSAQFHYDGTYTGLGIKNNGLNSSVVVYPNPATSQLNFVFTSEQTSGVEITLVNTLGQTVQTISRNNMGAGTQKITTDVSNLPAGTYYYRVTGKDKLSIGKVIIPR